MATQVQVQLLDDYTTTKEVGLYTYIIRPSRELDPSSPLRTEFDRLAAIVEGPTDADADSRDEAVTKILRNIPLDLIRNLYPDATPLPFEESEINPNTTVLITHEGRVIWDKYEGWYFND